MAISFLASQSIDGTLGVSGLATLSFAVESPKLYKANANLNIVGGGSQIDFTRCQIQLINNGGLKISVPASTTLTMSGKVLFDTILNAGIDTDKFLVSSSGVLSFRTGAEVRSDIGAGTGSVTGSGTAETVAKWSTGGTGIEDGPITFSSDDSIFAGKASFDTTQAQAAKIQAGAKTFDGSNGVYTDSRLGIMNNGSLTSIVNASTYDDATYPDYGLVFIQGPSTSSYNVWSLSPDGPTKGSDLNFIYQAQATNIHTQTPMLVLKGSDSSASFAGAVDVAGTITGTTGSFTGLVSGYDYQIVLTEWITSAASYVRLQMGVTGPTYRTSGYLSSGFTLCHNGGSSVVASNEQSTFIVGQNYNQTAAHEFSWTIDILDPVGSGKSQARGTGGGEGAGVDREVNFGEGIYNTNESHTAVQLFPTSGTFTSGTALLYRRSRS